MPAFLVVVTIVWRAIKFNRLILSYCYRPVGKAYLFQLSCILWYLCSQNAVSIPLLSKLTYTPWAFDMLKMTCSISLISVLVHLQRFLKWLQKCLLCIYVLMWHDAFVWCLSVPLFDYAFKKITIDWIDKIEAPTCNYLQGKLHFPNYQWFIISID